MILAPMELPALSMEFLSSAASHGSDGQLWRQPSQTKDFHRSLEPQHAFLSARMCQSYRDRWSFSLRRAEECNYEGDHVHHVPSVKLVT